MFRIAQSALVAALLYVASSTQANAQSYTYHTQSLLAFQEYTGNYAANDQARAKGMKIQLNANGTFAIAFPNTWYGSVAGYWTVSNGQIHFSGMRSLNTGVGNNWVYVQGVVFVSGGKTYMNYYCGAGNSVGAVINGSDFGSDASELYEAVVQISQ